MRVAVVGKGNVGGGLATLWRAAGHDVQEIGRDGGDFSFDFYMDTKNVCVALGTHKVPTLGS